MSCAPPPILMAIVGQLTRVLDPEERQCIQCLSPQGIAKFNRDQCADIPLETTLSELLIAFRRLKQRCEAFVDAVDEGTLDLSVLPSGPVPSPRPSPSHRNSSLVLSPISSPTTETISVVGSPPLSPTDLATLVTSVSAEKLRGLRDEEQMIDMALSLRDYAMLNCARRYSSSLGQPVRTNMLAPTSLIPKKTDAQLTPRRTEGEGSEESSPGEGVNTKSPRLEPITDRQCPSPLSLRRMGTPRLKNSFSAPDLLGGTPRASGSGQQQQTLPPVLRHGRWQIAKMANGNPKVSLDPSEAWFDLTPPPKLAPVLMPLNPKKISAGLPRSSSAMSVPTTAMLLSRSPSRSILKERLEDALSEDRRRSSGGSGSVGCNSSRSSVSGSNSSRSHSPHFGPVSVHVVPRMIPEREENEPMTTGPTPKMTLPPTSQPPAHLVHKNQPVMVEGDEWMYPNFDRIHK